MTKSKECVANHCKACLDCQLLQAKHIIEDAISEFVHLHSKHSTNEDIRPVYQACLEAKGKLITFDMIERKLRLN